MYKELVDDKNKHRNIKDPSRTVPPYGWSDVTELAKSQAEAAIVSGASSLTRPYFEMGHEEDGSGNWVAGWFLWHCFRNRDYRNKAKYGPAKGSAGESYGGAYGGGESSAAGAVAGGGSSAAGGMRSSNCISPSL